MEELLSFAEYEAGYFIFRLFWNMEREEKSLDGKMQGLRILIEVRHSWSRAEGRIRSIALTGRVGVEAQGGVYQTVTGRYFLPRMFSPWMSVIFFFFTSLCISLQPLSYAEFSFLTVCSTCIGCFQSSIGWNQSWLK